MWPEHRIASERHQEALRDAERRRLAAGARRTRGQDRDATDRRPAPAGVRSVWARLTTLDPRKA
jgi:hypothetical protein